MKAENSGGRELFYGWINVGIFFVIAFFTWGPQYSFGVFFKPLAEEFHWTRAETSGAMTLNLMIGGALGALGGYMSDRYGPRKIMVTSAVLIGIGYLFLSRLSTIWQLYLWFGLVVGMGMSNAYVVPAATISRWFIARRGLALGITLMGMSVAQILVPPVLAMLIARAGWRNTYLLIAIAALVLVNLLTCFLRKSPEDYGLHPDGNKDSLTDRPGQKGVLDGFTLRESVKLPAFWLIFTVWILMALPAFLTLVHVVPLATDVGIGMVEAAMIVSIIGIAGIGGRFIFGFTCDRWGCRTSAVIGLGIVATAMMAMVFAVKVTTFYAAATIFGLGYTGSDTALVKMSGDFFGRRFIGVIMGLLGLGWRIGASLGALLGGMIFDLTGKYQASFLAGAVSAAAALCLIFIIFRHKPHPD